MGVCRRSVFIIVFLVDVFEFDFVDLGELYKIDIGHDNSLFNSDWFLGKVEVIDVEKKKTSVFHCERWLAKGKDDGQIARSLFVEVSRSGSHGHCPPWE